VTRWRSVFADALGWLEAASSVDPLTLPVDVPDAAARLIRDLTTLLEESVVQA
jgi:hypothetical protein